MADPIRVVSLFCGMGNADAALYDAAEELGVPVEIVAAFDSWEPAVRVYNANLHPVAQVADVKQMADIPDCDLVIGGPPCQPFSMAGKREGHSDARNCIPDFLRLAGERAWVMENVRHLLIQAPFSVQLCAADFGDVTKRKRWFYSNYLLHVVPTPGPRRFRDIRDDSADVTGVDRSAWLERQKLEKKRWGTVAVQDDGFLGSLTSEAWHGVQSGPQLVAMRSYPKPYSVVPDDGMLGSLTSHSHDQPLKDGVRCPSLLEMARAHSVPDSWNWLNSNKGQRGKMTANSWPRGMGKAVCKAILTALFAEREMAA